MFRMKGFAIVTRFITSREHDTGKGFLDGESEPLGFKTWLLHLLECIYLPEPTSPHL